MKLTHDGNFRITDQVITLKDGSRVNPIGEIDPVAEAWTRECAKISKANPTQSLAQTYRVLEMRGMIRRCIPQATSKKLAAGLSVRISDQARDRALHTLYTLRADVEADQNHLEEFINLLINA